MNYENLIVDRKGKVISLSINRPEKGNSLSNQVIEEFIEFFSKTTEKGDALVVTINGVGEKFFCAGADIGDLDKEGISHPREVANRYALLYESIRRSPMISIAVVNGLALGGGAGLAAACDIGIAAKRAKFGITEINIGVPPTTVLIPIIQAIGNKKTLIMALTGRLIDSGEALRIGLISSVVEDESLEDKSRELAFDLAGKSGIALSISKQAVHGANEFNYSRAYEYLKELTTYSWLTEDCKEGFLAFKEKRKPVWRHK